MKRIVLIAASIRALSLQHPVKAHLRAYVVVLERDKAVIEPLDEPVRMLRAVDGILPHLPAVRIAFVVVNAAGIIRARHLRGSKLVKVHCVAI